MALSSIFPESLKVRGRFIKRQLFEEPPAISRNDVNLHGKTAIVTGSNTGLGLECSRQLLSLGLSKLILAVRDKAKGEAAKKELVGQNTEGVVIEVWELDLSVYDSILKFVERTKTLERIDIVVLNASVVKFSLQHNPNTGHDEVIQVNCLSTYLLTILLLPVLKKKKGNQSQNPSRLVIVTSDTVDWAIFREKEARPLLPAFDKPEYFDDQDRYPTSKLLGQLFLTELVKRVPPSVAIINAPNPGLCYGTGLNKDADGTLTGFILHLMCSILGRSPAVGARAITDAAVNHGEESHGRRLECGQLYE